MLTDRRRLTLSSNLNQHHCWHIYISTNYHLHSEYNCSDSACNGSVEHPAVLFPTRIKSVHSSQKKRKSGPTWRLDLIKGVCYPFLHKTRTIAVKLKTGKQGLRKAGCWEWVHLNENCIGLMDRWFAETSEKQCGCLRAGCWNNLDWGVNMFVCFGMHEVVVAGHMRATGLDGQIPVVRQRQSFCPRFRKRKAKPHSCLACCWLCTPAFS